MQRPLAIICQCIRRVTSRLLRHQAIVFPGYTKRLDALNDRMVIRSRRTENHWAG
ncbi:hypothetical protein DACRYDRAFT_25264 [Dacryopinax primogenitus]|uniref:Uncharacterized protein n=1 Tax=Dacryopinax primogenitus (strain DJM 731) TaxID=1858805 RepID=M5FPL0_DACPD|nr:uncharacterized protein DACRYDRAFT_25264 [Dacryopinax primogenitus]EJT97143.1 hypothetical protein DACRYDRAFT_25264 [Dacryopinax primogenitus]